MRFSPLVLIAALGCAAHRPVPISPASSDAAFWKKMKAGEYVGAADIAYRAKSDPWYLGMAFAAAKRKAFHLPPNAAQKELLSWSHAGPVDADGLKQEVAIACRYGPTRQTRELAVLDAMEIWRVKADGAALEALVTERCPLDGRDLEEVIAYAKSNGKYGLLKRAADTANLSEPEKAQLAKDVASRRDCFDGVELGLEFGLSDLKMEEVVRWCDASNLPHQIAWRFRDADQARYVFFAAVREGAFNLAFALVSVAHPGHETEATEFICQEAMRGRNDVRLMEAFPRLPRETKERMLEWLIAYGRYRLAGWLTDDQRWEHKAFDAAIAAGKYEDAAEIAEMGVELTFRKTGPIQAFHAAMMAKDFATGRALKYRYAISDDDYWKAYNETFDKDPKGVPTPPSAKPKRVGKPPCKETGDWEVERCPK